MRQIKVTLPEEKFKTIDGLRLGDSIVVIRNNSSITGIMMGYQTSLALFKETSFSETIRYYRYQIIWLYHNNKTMEIHRQIEDNDLRVYISRAVLFEKFKKYELLFL